MNRRVHTAAVVRALLALALLVPSQSTALQGDVNGDCSVDVADVVLLQRHLTGEEPLDGAGLANADVGPLSGGEFSSDGRVDVGDLAALTRGVAGEVTFPDVLTPTPTIDPLGFTETSSNPIAISGTGPADEYVEIYVNGRLHLIQAVATSGTFSLSGFAAVALEDGVNEIHAVAHDGTNFTPGMRTCPSETVTVTYTGSIDHDISGSNAVIPDGTIVAWTPGVPPAPYVVTDDLVIEPGAELILLPGTELQLAPGVEIFVDESGSEATRYSGALQILGTASNPVVLKSSETCSVANRWDGIRIESRPASLGDLKPNAPQHDPDPDANRIDHAYIECTTNPAIDIRAGGKAWVTNSTVTDSGGGVRLQAGWYSHVRFNTFTDLTNDAIHMLYNAGVGHNVIDNVRYGIVVNAPGDFQFGGGNVVTNSRSGIRFWVSAAGAITTDKQTLTNNCHGVAADALPTSAPFNFSITNSSIYDNNNCPGGCVDSHDCKDLTVNGASGSAFLDMTENWWGSTDVATIQGRIDFGGDIDYVPFLSGPHDAGGVPVADDDLIQDTVNDATKPVGSDWIIIGEVTVADTDTLTIPAGTTVELLEGATLVVDGTLDVNGTIGTEVLFTGLAPPGETPGPGHWDGIVVQAGGMATIEGAIFEHATTALTGTGDGTSIDVTSSIFRKFSQAGVRIEDDADAAIYENRDVGGTLGFFGGPSGARSIEVEDVDDAMGTVEIDENDISGGGIGILLDDASVTIRGNLIESANFGIQIRGGGIATITKVDGLGIAGNEITGNCRGIDISSSGQPTPDVQHNLIHTNDGCPGNSSGNKNYTVSSYSNGASTMLEAGYNWWGSDDLATIAALIRDHTDDPSLPIVDFIPFYTDAGLSADSGTAGYLIGHLSSDPGNTSDELTGAYEVAGGIVVDATDVLRFGPGTTLDMAAGTGIEVQGKLIVDGTGTAVVIQGLDGATWDGISVSGTTGPGSEPKLDLVNATIRDASTAVSAENTGSLLVSIVDTTIEYFYNGIWLEDVGDGVIDGVTIDNHSSSGTGILVIDSHVDIDDSLIQRLLLGVTASGSSNPLIGVTAGNDILKAHLRSITFDGVTLGSIVGNVIDNAGLSPRRGTGIRLTDTESAPTIQNNTISNLDIGIHVRDDSQPTIGGDTGSPHNTITGNRIGILLESTDDEAALTDQPVATINRNNLSSNDDANLQITGFPQAAAVVIDAQENWWGTTDVDDIRASIVSDATNEIAVDFSGYLGTADATTPTGGSNLFSTIFSQIVPDQAVLAPTLTPSDELEIGFQLLADADANGLDIEVYEDLDDALATLVYTAECSGVTAGAQSCSWDGTDSEGTLTGATGRIVPDGAYLYRIVATSGGKTFVYDPPRPTGGAAPSIQTHFASSYDIYANDYPKLVFKMTTKAGRVTFVMADTSHGPLLQQILDYTPFPLGSDHYVAFDGRNGGILRDDLEETNHFYISGSYATPLKFNHVLVRDTTPEVRHESFDVTASPPKVEVKSDPYFIVLSYEQVTRIAYDLDQDATVTIKILKPGTGDPSNPSNVVETVVSGASQTAGTHEFVWDGHPDADTHDMQAETNGAYTFTIEAENPTESYLSSIYRGVIQVLQ